MLLVVLKYVSFYIVFHTSTSLFALFDFYIILFSRSPAFPISPLFAFLKFLCFYIVFYKIKNIEQIWNTGSGVGGLAIEGLRWNTNIDILWSETSLRKIIHDSDDISHLTSRFPVHL